MPDLACAGPVACFGAGPNAICDGTINKIVKARGSPKRRARGICHCCSAHSAATATCFIGDLTALVLMMLKTCRRPRRPCGPYHDLTTLLQRSRRPHGAPAATNGDLAVFPSALPMSSYNIELLQPLFYQLKMLVTLFLTSIR